jgi:hypothetical protein
MDFLEAMHDPLLPIDPRAADEALARWDELPPRVLSRLSTDPVHGPRLARLRQAEAWLRTEGARARRERLAGADAALAACPSPASCPSPEELYDLGRGPGHGPLDPGRRAELDRHVRVCLDCELLVETLASRPPVPLELAPLDEHEALEHEPAARPIAEIATGFPTRVAARTATATGPARELAPLSRLRPLVPLVAAASLIAALGIWSMQGGTGADTSLGLPQAPHLRGAAASDLLWPRGLVLAPPQHAQRAGELAFEIEQVDGADEYRIELYYSDPDASPFELGRRVASHTGGEPSIALAALLPEGLEPGSYTWRAWARIDGLERRIGAHDFEVVHDAELWRALSDLPQDAAPERVAELVRRLHERGFTSDARALARRLPATAERDAYLDARPGR